MKLDKFVRNYVLISVIAATFLAILFDFLGILS